MESAEGVEQVQAHGFTPLVDEDEEDRQYRIDMVKMHTEKLEPKEKARVNAFSFQVLQENFLPSSLPPGAGHPNQEV